MNQTHSEILPSEVSHSNMKSYEQARSEFSWDEIERHFTWYETGKVNMAYEAIDRHVTEGEEIR